MKCDGQVSFYGCVSIWAAKARERERAERRIIAFPRKTKIDCIRADTQTASTWLPTKWIK